MGWCLCADGLGSFFYFPVSGGLPEFTIMELIIHSDDLLAKTASLQASSDHADLVVWDATPAGIVAAIAAARQGLKTLVITNDTHIGGLQTSGLGFTNAGERATIGGLAREFHQRVKQYYSNRYGADSPQTEACSDGFFFEPHVAEYIYLEWLRESEVGIVTGEYPIAVERVDKRLTVLKTKSGRAFHGRCFIDASYEGDLIALANCSWHIGRESKDTYGESMAGVTYPPERAGEGDAKLQPFDYRCCLTNCETNRIPFHEPAGYDPRQYAWHSYRIRIKNPPTTRAVLPLNIMPNQKTDSRVAEWPGRSWDYIQADWQRRRDIDAAHRAHSAGYLWFVITDPSVPKPIREDLAQWGLAADEFTDNGNWPYHIYVREGRRLRGEYIMTQGDCLQDRFKQDSIGLCSWYMDVHPVDLIVRDGVYHEDGRINLRLKPFEIPYRSLLAQRGECENLLAPVPLSASHVAFSSIRVEPVWMILGHACGLAAALAMEHGTSLHSLPPEILRQKLQEQNQLIDARPFTEVWPSPKKS